MAVKARIGTFAMFVVCAALASPLPAPKPPKVSIDNVPLRDEKVAFNRTPVTARFASYAKGEQPQFKVSALAGGQPAVGATVEVSVSVPGECKPETVAVKLDAQGQALLTIPSPDRPGWVFVRGVGDSASAAAGAMYDGDNIRASAPPPADFKQFWADEIAALKQVPIKAKLTEVEPIPSQKGKIRTWEFEVSCAGPRPATGYLSMPINARPKSLPLIVGFNGAADASAYRSDHYGDVAIAVQANKFGIPNGLTDEQYQSEYYESDIKNYPMKGLDDPHTAMYKWIIVRHYRVLEYAKSLPGWNGKLLLLNGESFGGGQVLILGALDPDVTFVSSCVPALCDHNGRLVGRCNGYPQFWNVDENGGLPESMRKISENARYFDTMNFCTLFRPGQEVTIGTGFRDTLCPPDGVFAAYHNIPEGVKKTLWLNPVAGHDAGNWHAGKRIFELLGKE